MSCSSERSDANRRMGRRTTLGQALFDLGILLVVLRGLSSEVKFPGIPAFWYENQALWIGVGIGMTAFGAYILWGNPYPDSIGWRPAIPGKRFRNVTLFTRENCHLCEDAAELLNGYRRWLPTIEEIDIDTDPQLVERFNTCVPVVTFDGKIRFRGRIDETLLRRLIDGTPVFSESTPA